MGESCKNNGCERKYEGAEGDYTNCKYHPGYPVFHEGTQSLRVVAVYHILSIFNIYHEALSVGVKGYGELKHLQG